MAEIYTIYHNPRCSKSRQTLALLEQNGVSPRVVLYLQDPPTAAELKKLAKALSKKPREFIRSGEEAYKTLGLSDPNLNDNQLFDAMAAHPKLIERPIVVKGSRAILGRPPETVLELL